ncbi:MAG: molybdenum cofactor guanylyltransferase [Bacteroidota bacterium]
MILADRLYGLVLSGGKSTRMGKDKGRIIYHKRPHREHLYHLLDTVCERTFVSIRPEQKEEIPARFNRILDQDHHGGPFNGILSAHMRFPTAAWLVLACDLPFMDTDALEQLILARDTMAMATALTLKEDPLPEPMCAIWEPKALDVAQNYLNRGNGSSPRKFLIHSNCRLVFPKNPQVLMNANSQEEYTAAMEKLGGL